ncbi:MAG TPA: hypothetical protein VJV74_05970 [Terriglobia bacterium]|nr:hypothetical protein [Terriglobia bacterium]
MTCWKCGQSVAIPSGGHVASRDTCPRCDSDLHACKNCQFYDPAKHNQCAETQAEWVRDKERANYCDYFRPASAGATVASPAAPGADDVKRKFDALFRRG